MQVDPLDFFGAALGSAMLGALLTLALGQWDSTTAAIRQTCLNSLRASSVGALFSIETAFGFGALLGFASLHLGKALAESSKAEKQALLKINEAGFALFLRTLGEGDPGFWKHWQEAKPKLFFLDQPKLLDGEFKYNLPSECHPFPVKDMTLPSEIEPFDSTIKLFDATPWRFND
jgi:hypothetical protein